MPLSCLGTQKTLDTSTPSGRDHSEDFSTYFQICRCCYHMVRQECPGYFAALWRNGKSILYHAIDLLFTSREGLVAGVELGGILGYRDCEIIEFLIFGERRSGINKIATLDFWRTHYQFCYDKEIHHQFCYDNDFIYVFFPIPSSNWSLTKPLDTSLDANHL